MTDDLSTYGLGALPDVPDERDYPISAHGAWRPGLIHPGDVVRVK